jgi:hypothetical protein
VPPNKEVHMNAHKEISNEEVAHRAYELYVQRGKEPGKDVEDWATAEKELGAEPTVAPARTMAARVGQN